MNPNLEFWLNFTRLIVLLFTAFIAWMTYRSHLLLKEFQPDFNVLLSWPETVMRLFLVIFCLFLAWLSGLPSAQLGFMVKYLWRSIALGIGIGVTIQVIINIITWQVLKIFGRDIYSPWLILNILPRQKSEWLWVALAFIPPIVMEELLFRTLWVGLFQNIIPITLLIMGTSMLFGFMHQPQGKLGMVGAGTINILFCLLFIWSGEVLITLIAHYTVNMLQLITTHFQRDWLEPKIFQPIDK